MSAASGAWVARDAMATQSALSKQPPTHLAWSSAQLPRSTINKPPASWQAPVKPHSFSTVQHASSHT